MFITDKLIYLQLPKTASTHIGFLLSHIIGGEQLRQHKRLNSQIDINDKLIVGSVRDPWDWYVSLWLYGHTNDIFRLRSKNFRKLGWRRDFGRALKLAINEGTKPVEAWRETYADSSNPKLFRRWLTMLMDPRRSNDFMSDYKQVSTSCGFLTFYYLRHYTSCHVPDLRSFGDIAEGVQQHSYLGAAIRCENLEADFIDVLLQAGYTLKQEQIDFINGAARCNVSEKRMGNSSFYYDKECAQLVADRDKLLITKYGYTQPEIEG